MTATSFLSWFIAACAAVSVSCAQVRPGPAAEAPEQRGSDPWEDARRRGIEFRAVGQEPGWLLEIDEQDEVRFVYDNGERDMTVDARPPIVLDDMITYELRDEERSLTILIRPRPCTDVMSGAAYPMTVTVTFAEMQYRGCGRPLPP